MDGRAGKTDRELLRNHSAPDGCGANIRQGFKIGVALAREASSVLSTGASEAISFIRGDAGKQLLSMAERRLQARGIGFEV
jgi:hypothetical protein